MLPVVRLHRLKICHMRPEKLEEALRLIGDREMVRHHSHRAYNE